MPNASGHFKGISLAGLDLPWLWPEKDDRPRKKTGRRTAATRGVKNAGAKRVETNSAPARETR